MIEVRHTLAEDALDALRRLTFQEFGSNAGEWRRWWETNRAATWEALLSQYVQYRMKMIAGAEPSIMSQWMYQLTEADSPVVLPFVKSFLINTGLDLSSFGPSVSSGAGRAPVLRLLLELVDKGSVDAKHLLYSCLAAKDSDLRQDCPVAVAVFDRNRALDCFLGELGDRDPYVGAHAAQSLVHFGDPRGISRLIDELSATESPRRNLAYDTLKHYTQADIPYDPDAPARARNEAVAAWRSWWSEHQRGFNVKVQAAHIDAEVFR